MTNSQHAYEVRPRKDKRGVDLISDVLPFGGLWYAEPNAISHKRRIEPCRDCQRGGFSISFRSILTA